MPVTSLSGMEFQIIRFFFGFLTTDLVVIATARCRNRLGGRRLQRLPESGIPSKRAHPDPVLFNNREITLPVLAGLEDVRIYSATAEGDFRNTLTRIIPAEGYAVSFTASSPKSLSQVRMTRFSRYANLITSGSEMPGDSVRIHRISCPASLSTFTTEAGIFSSASSFIRQSFPHDGWRTHALTGRVPVHTGCMQGYPRVQVRDTLFRITDSSHPEARSPRTRSTEILVPRITGLPASTEESRIIRGLVFMKKNSDREIL